MKIHKIAFLIAFISGSALANNNLTLNKVTLFLKGAELQGQTNVSLAKGESEIILTGIANSVNPDSIAVGFGLDSKVKILSTSLKNKTELDNQQNSNIVSLQTQLKQLQTKYASTNIQYQAVSETIVLLQGNSLSELIKTTQMKDAIDFIKTNLVTALNEQYTLQTGLDKLKQQISECEQKIEQEQASSTNLITVKVYTDNAVTLPVTVSYVITQAGWEPSYDVRVTDINSPLQLTYKANVYQQSGLDWQNVDFSLSTANPSEGITAPTLLPWQINMYSRAKSGSYFSKNEKDYDDINVKASRSISLTDDNALINTTGIDTRFEVKLPYTIKNNSQDNVLILQDKQVEAKYRYTSTPKLDSSVYLQAQVTDWDKLNLLPGKSIVFFNGNYVGESFITTKDAKDTLDLSLGRDKSILITRNRNLNETSKPTFFGDNVSQRYSYTIDVKNTKTQPIDITINDQLPVVQNKSILLENAKYDGASFNKETGLLTWSFSLSPEEDKNLNLSFKLTYPKDKVNDIIGL